MLETPDITPAAEPTAPIVAPVDIAPTTETADTDKPLETGSLREHESKFGPERNERGQFQPKAERHRAESQKASPDDLPKINEYTKRLREAEKEIGIEPLEGESPRVFEMRRRAEMAERVRDAAKKAKEATPSAPMVAPRPVAPAPGAFTDPEPKLEDFAKEADPYASWLRASAKWDLKKEAYDAAIHRAETSQASAIQQHRMDYGKRYADYIAKNPDADAVIQSAPHANMIMPLAMEAAIVLAADDNGPRFSEYLARNPHVFNEIYVLSEGKAVTKPLVEHIQRLLTERSQAVSTGAAATRPSVPPAPRLPTPVKTAPQPVKSDGRPPDDAPLSVHEKWHYPDGPRGRFRA